MARIHFGRGVLFLAVLFPVAHPRLLRASDSPVVAVTGTIFSDATNSRIANAVAVLCDAGGTVLPVSFLFKDCGLDATSLKRKQMVFSPQSYRST